MSTRIPRAHETSWAQEAIAEQRSSAGGRFQYPGHNAEPCGDVVYLADSSGQCRAVDASIVRTEHWRVSQVMASAALPDDCSPEILSAPARGPVRAFMPMSLYPKGEDGWELKPSGHMDATGKPRKSIQRADAFDVMGYRSRLSHKGKRADFIAPFSPAQIAMGRHYRNLVERYLASGVRCSSVETMAGGGSGGDGGFIDAVLWDRDQIQRIHHRIGDGLALEVKRQGKIKRGAITDRRLVDMVCLEDKTLAEVLRAHGWSKRGGNTAILQRALSDALIRMMGPIRRRAGYAMHDQAWPSGFKEWSAMFEKGD